MTCYVVVVEKSGGPGTKRPDVIVTFGHMVTKNTHPPFKYPDTFSRSLQLKTPTPKVSREFQIYGGKGVSCGYVMKSYISDQLLTNLLTV